MYLVFMKDSHQRFLGNENWVLSFFFLFAGAHHYGCILPILYIIFLSLVILKKFKIYVTRGKFPITKDKSQMLKSKAN